MDWTRKALYKLATGPAYWPPIDTVKLTFSSLYGEGKYTSSRPINAGVACSVFMRRSFGPNAVLSLLTMGR